MEDFSFFSMDSNNMVYQTLGYLNENNEPVVTSPTSRVKYYTLGKESPFVSYSDTNAAEYVNLAVIIKDYTIILNGEVFDGNVVLAEGKRSGLNYASLSFNLGEVTFKAGDTISINLILLPWGSQLTPEGDISNVLNVRNDTCLDPIKADVKTGTLIHDTYMPKIKAENGVAEFTLSGADNHMAVRVYGFDDYTRPIIEEYVDGAWVEYKTASVNGYDGYMAHYDGDGTYSFSFVVDMSNGDRTFRVKQSEIDTPDIPDQPESEPETPVESVKPIAIAHPAYLVDQAAIGNQMAVSAVTTENDRTFIRLTATGGDPYFSILNAGANVESDIMAIAYRTNSNSKGQFYVGSGPHLTAQGDNFIVTWTEGDWNLLVMDLSTVEGLTSITGDMVNYLRMDFFHNGTFAEGDYFDIEYVAFFKTVADAETYYNDLH